MVHDVYSRFFFFGTHPLNTFKFFFLFLNVFQMDNGHRFLSFFSFAWSVLWSIHPGVLPTNGKLLSCSCSPLERSVGLVTGEGVCAFYRVTNEGKWKRKRPSKMFFCFCVVALFLSFFFGCFSFFLCVHWFLRKFWVRVRVYEEICFWKN